MGTSSQPSWTNVTVVKQDGNQGVASYVLVTPFSIGYSVLGEILKNQQPMAKLSRHGVTVEATALSVTYAMMELGLSFGNNGAPPEQLTANIHNAQSRKAWPIAGYTYLVMRKNTLRPNATCENVKQTVDFWTWFWYSDAVKEKAAHLGKERLSMTLCIAEL